MSVPVPVCPDEVIPYIPIVFPVSAGAPAARVGGGGRLRVLWRVMRAVPAFVAAITECRVPPRRAALCQQFIGGGALERRVWPRRRSAGR